MSKKKYEVVIQRTVTEYWTVEAESESDARMMFESDGDCTFSKQNKFEVLDVDEA